MRIAAPAKRRDLIFVENCCLVESAFLSVSVSVSVSVAVAVAVAASAFVAVAVAVAVFGSHATTTLQCEV